MIQKSRMASITVLLCLVALNANSQSVELYEGNRGTQDLVCRIDISNGGFHRVKFKSNKACDNDEARSLVLVNVPANRIIRLFDSPDGKTNDDWVEIRTRRNVSRLTIDTFERSLDNADVSVSYKRKNGLDGKVSLFISGPPMADPCAERAVDIRQDGGLIIAEGGVGCQKDFRLEIRIKENVSMWFDKTLKRKKDTNNRIVTSYTCRRGGEGRLFAELKVNGKKYRSREISGASCQPSP